ncbi:DUF4405 domain-containing protein [Planctomycetales bacterium 10988]|nr:DUF4405 domain-containing protein [Planctomycetales bacterium 10988]
MRHVVNFGLFFTFLTLAVTGVMAFSLPFSLTTTRVHVGAGVAMLALVVLHVLVRLSYFQKPFRFKKKASAKRKPILSGSSVLLIVMAWGGLLALAMAALPPFTWLMDQGYEARHRAEIVRASSLVGFGEPSKHSVLINRITEDPTTCDLSLYLSFSRDLKELPAIAVWAETTTGAMIETLYLQDELAFAEDLDWHGALTQRNHILPLWRNRYTMISGVGPDGEADTVSGATDTHSFALDPYLVPGENQKIIICVEINAPQDPNEKWTDSQIGQPSLLYTAYLQIDNENPYAILELTGHGGDAENNGNIQYDLEGFSSAKELADLFLVKIEKPSTPNTELSP